MEQRSLVTGDAPALRRTRRRGRNGLIALLAALSLIVCASPIAYIAYVFPTPAKYARAIEHGRRTIPLARQFEERFPTCEHFISYYTGSFGSPQWNSEVVLDGRIRIMVQFAIRVTRGGREVEAVGKPEFVGYEFTTQIQSDGRRYETPGERGRQFDEQRWGRFFRGELTLDELIRSTSADPSTD